MPQLSLEQRRFLVETFIQTGSTRQSLSRFSQEYPDRKPPTRANLCKLIVKFRKTNSLRNDNAGHSGRRITVRTPERIEEVRQAVQGQVTSTRKVAKEQRISQSSAHRILRSDIKLKPYKLITVQGLSPQDKQKREQQSNLYLRLLRRIKLPFLFFSDECNFYLDGTVNKHNCIAWDFQRPEWHQTERKLGSPKVCVWAALSQQHLIGPYFFTGTVDGDGYLQCLKKCAIPGIRRCVGENMGITWFQQDGATSHRTQKAKTMLKKTFGKRTIGLGLQHQWPARSPDLSVLDFFLWSFLKDIVFKAPQPHSIEDLKLRIKQAFRLVRQQKMEQVSNAVGQWRRRLRTCIHEHGGNIDSKLR